MLKMNVRNFEDNNIRYHRRGYHSDIITGEISIVITFAIKLKIGL